MSATPTYENFDIEIGQGRAGVYPVTVRAFPAGETPEPVEVTILRDDEPMRAWLQRLQDGFATREELVALGRRLAGYLLPVGPVRDLYQRSLGGARARQTGLRMRLHISPPELATLPWEYAYDEDSDDFFALNPRTVLVRYHNEPLPPISITSRTPTPILAVISNPSDAQPIETVREVRNLLRALGRLLEAGQVRLDLLLGCRPEERHEIEALAAAQPGSRVLEGTASIDDLRDALRQGYRVIHYLGHGGFDEGAGGCLLMIGEQGEAAVVDATTLARELRETSAAVVVLLACSSAAESTAQAFMGLAPRLIRAGVPAVVAMQYAVTADSASTFSRTLYKALADGWPLDAAVTEGRKAISARQTTDDMEWGIPVLFMRSPDGVIWREEPGPQGGAGPAAPGAGGRTAIFEERVEIHGDFVMGDVAQHSPTGDNNTARAAELSASDDRSRPLRETDPAGPVAPTESTPAMRPITAGILQWFVDRTAVLDRFDKMLAGHDPTLVLTVAGPEGIGKTWLLLRLREAAATRAVPTALISFSAGETFDDLWLIQRAAAELGAQHFVGLNQLLDDATTREVVLKSASGAGDRRAVFQGPVEIRGNLVQGDVISGNTFNFIGENPEVRRIWRNRFIEAFFADLARLASAHGAALLFDSCEAAPATAAGWLTSELCRRLGAGALPGVWLVLAGETVPAFPPEWHGSAGELRLDPLPAKEVRTYLLDKRELAISEATVAAIYAITGGRPYLVEMMANGPLDRLPEEADEDRLLDVLVDGILARAPEADRETLRTIAIPEWFDARLLAELLDSHTDVDQRLAGVREYTFVEPEQGGRYRLRPAVRRKLLATWAGQPEAFRERQERAARYFEARGREAADPREREEYERQAVGHQLAIAEAQGRERLWALFEAAETHHALATCEQLLKRAEAVPGLSDLTRSWLRYLHARLALVHNQYAGCIDLLGEVVREAGPGSELEALANWSLGQAAAAQGGWPAAIDQHEKSRRYFVGQGNSRRAGQVMLSLGDAYLDQAAALGGPIEPRLAARGLLGTLAAVPAFLVALPFVLYARLIRRWRLPPLQHGMNYRNWTLVRLLLSAEAWYRTAISAFEPAGAEDLFPSARWRLAQTYHRLGWRRDAEALFEQVLSSGPVVSNAYLQARVRTEHAETLLAAGETAAAQQELEAALHVFESYADVHAQGEAQALLGQVAVRGGRFEDALAQYQGSLGKLGEIHDLPGTAVALHSLRRALQEVDPPPAVRSRAEALIDSTPEKTYLPRVPDRLAAALELLVWVGLVLVVIAGLMAFGFSATLSMGELYARLFSARGILGALGRLILLAWVLVGGSSLLGLALIAWGARDQIAPERLNRIMTSPEAIASCDYWGKEVARIAWDDVHALATVERVFWRAPSALLSQLRVYGPANAIVRVPATMLWYDALKADIAGHLQARDPQPLRRRWDIHVVRSRLGFLFLASPLLLALGGMITWNLVPLPLGSAIAATVGPALLVLGLIALVAGPYWWLALHPLWAGYQVAPRSRAPWLAGGFGAVIIGLAVGLAWQQPFFPFRNWLDATVHPLGFLLLIAGAVWIVAGQGWQQEPISRHEPLYPLPVRAAAGAALVVTLAVGGWFAARNLVPYLDLFAAMANLNHGNPAATVTQTTRALAAGPDLADGYYFRALAEGRLGQHDLAIRDLTRLIDSRGATLAYYRLARARAYQHQLDAKAGCPDLAAALDSRRWPLSDGDRKQAQQDGHEWGCE